ncbi:FAD-dependent oxidoreductase [Paenibacillus sp. HN-1]|uniref:FAD-dependent oxidoreductase n=1 Tax=Paenibacillus TaxID=44249 RepID=UPI001CA9EF20|nr:MULTISPECIES: FAD-dependent oxidoreductase [Paenibacillus]MBY9077720.1 FAD-dependent oxidoreductase [Paenibacillus sp. CGMCC 1.18879]MBY9083701.1 FAD-dependent oxidoreductase [Paenibacillus sinensis]
MDPEYTRQESLPKMPESLWRRTTELPSFPRLAEDHTTEVAIVGGGIVGITTAYLLTEAGYKVTLLEADELLTGTTGFTTAKITAQHGLIYDNLLKHFGEEQALAYYRSNNEGMEWILQTAEKLGLSCGIQREDAYLYSPIGDDKTLKTLRKEFEAYRKLGLPGEWVDYVSLPMQIGGAIKLPGQARFHPLEYLKGLLQKIHAKGGVVYEHTAIGEKVESGDGLTLFTEHGNHRIKCRHAVSASHFPFYDGRHLYFTLLHAERSYALAFEPESDYEGGMYLSAGGPKRSLRAVEWEGKRLVIAGGENHKTGQSICTFGHYENLETFAGGLLGIRSIPFRWSAQDLVTMDLVPYIGKMSDDKEIYVATGFAKWGMTNGTLAARLITDQIMRKHNPYTELYAPSRFKAVPGIKNFLVQNLNVANELIEGKVELIHRKLEELQPDEGAVVRHDGRRVGAYKDPEGGIHLVDRTCTHLGCECAWNESERSWDCPCHGSRFSYDGEVLEGPAVEPLARVEP